MKGREVEQCANNLLVFETYRRKKGSDKNWINFVERVELVFQLFIAFLSKIST